MLNSMIYEVYLPNGQVHYYAATFVIKNILSQVDYEGHSVTLVD